MGSSLFLVGNRMVESSVSSPCALCLCGSSSYTVVITSGERRSTTETQSSQSTHRAPNQELENHRNLWLATGNSEEPIDGCALVCMMFIGVHDVYFGLFTVLKCSRFFTVSFSQLIL